MTTGTKAMARWEIGSDGLSNSAEMLWHYQGRYVLFTDHERVVGEAWARTGEAQLQRDQFWQEAVELRTALAASRAEVEENEKVINVWRGRTQRAEAEAKGLSQSLTDSLECEEDYLREISELRAEVEGLKKLLGATAQCLADLSNDIGGWAVEEVIEEAMNAAMENNNV